MQDYNRYREEKNLSNNDLIRVIKGGFPSFSKVQMSFASNPQKSALCLVPEAEALLVEAYGDGEGLSVKSRKPSPAKKPNRKKPHRLVVYIDDALFAKVQRTATQSGYATMQAFLEGLIADRVETYEAMTKSPYADLLTDPLCDTGLLEGWE